MLLTEEQVDTIIADHRIDEIESGRSKLYTLEEVKAILAEPTKAISEKSPISPSK
ncbi:MAG: hypothetical protein K8S56_10145 [Candidatus Cloacimonetes bacterium]|nr:hypothetical protein [Candidatus Cloacimonadota bacterium]